MGQHDYIIIEATTKKAKRKAERNIIKYTKKFFLHMLSTKTPTNNNDTFISDQMTAGSTIGQHIKNEACKVKSFLYESGLYYEKLGEL